jgi:hypothetical protein
LHLSGSILAALVICSACQSRDGGTLPQTAPALSAAQSIAAPNVGTPTVYVLNAVVPPSYQIVGYAAQNKRNARPLCARSFNAGGYAIASDAKGNVYVAGDNPNGSVINVHAPDCGNIITTVSDPFNEAIAVAVKGTAIYAAGLNNLKEFSVAVCSLTGCTRTLKSPVSVNQLSGLAVDSKGNVWASFYDTYGYVRLIVWRHGRMPGHALGQYMPPNPGDRHFDDHGTLVAVEYDAPAIYTFACDTRQLKCSQLGKFTVKGTPQYGALNAANTDIQVRDYESQSVDVYGYPSFTYKYTYAKGPSGHLQPSGITQIGGE